MQSLVHLDIKFWYSLRVTLSTSLAMVARPPVSHVSATIYIYTLPFTFILYILRVICVFTCTLDVVNWFLQSGTSLHSLETQFLVKSVKFELVLHPKGTIYMNLTSLLTFEIRDRYFMRFKCVILFYTNFIN